MKTEFLVSKEMMQMTITFILIGAGLSHAFWGSLSDHFGRKPILQLGYVVFIAGSTISALSHSLLVLLGGCFLIGAGMAANSGLARAIVRDTHRFSKTAKLLAMGVMITGLTPALAAYIGVELQQAYSWHANFFLLALVGCLGLLLVRTSLRETVSLSEASAWSLQSFVLETSALLGNKKFIAYFLGVGFVYSSPVIIATEVPFIFLDNLQTSTSVYVNCFALIVFSYVIGSLFVYRFIKKSRLNWFFTVAIISMLISAIGLLIGNALNGQINLSLFLACLIVYQFGSGILLPVLMAKAMSVDPEHHGLASAIIGVGRAMTPVIALSLLIVMHVNLSIGLAIVLTVIAVSTGILLIFFTNSIRRRP